MSLQAFREAVKAAGGFRSARVGGMTHLYTGDIAAQVEEALRKTAIRTGEAIHWPNGDREFYDWVEEYSVSAEGAVRYEWHPDGNRVRHTLVKKVVHPDGKMDTTQVRKAWRVLGD